MDACSNVPTTVFAVGMALERNPDAASAMLAAGWEVRRAARISSHHHLLRAVTHNASSAQIATHGYRWIDYQNVEPDVEAVHIKKVDPSAGACVRACVRF
jgi:peptidoglycan/xylan/chitin deacetylase (PgdA/CDA1 family)